MGRGASTAGPPPCSGTIRFGGAPGGEVEETEKDIRKDASLFSSTIDFRDFRFPSPAPPVASAQQAAAAMAAEDSPTSAVTDDVTPVTKALSESALRDNISQKVCVVCTCT